MKQGIYIVLLAVGFILGVLFFRGCGPNVTPLERTILCDTMIIRDTIRQPVPKPEVITVVRFDTVRLQTKPVEDMKPAMTSVDLSEDTGPRVTLENDLIIPITRNIYKTEDYEAIIEGYRARLVHIELYPKTVTITKTVIRTRSPRWVLTVGPGVGYGTNGVRPYVGITAGFVLWSR